MKLLIGFLVIALITSCGKDENNSLPNNQNNENNENNVNNFEVDLGEFANNDPGYVSTTPLIQFNYDYYRTYCERLITCRDTPIIERFLSQRGIGSFEACFVTHVQGNSPQRWVQLEAQDRTFSIPSKYDDCLESVGSLTCDELIFVNPDNLPTVGACSEVFQGGKETGQACEDSIECPVDNFCATDGFTCNGICSDDVNVCAGCSEDEWCSGTMCVARSAEGESCEFDGSCAIGSGCSNGTCTAWTRVEIGDACDGANYCPIGSICWNQSCVKLGKTGDDCSLDALCDLHLSCNDGTCGKPKRDGECQFHFECVSRRCDPEGQCEAPEALCFNE